MPKHKDKTVEVALWLGRGGRPDGPLHPVVSQKLEAAIQNCNAVNAQGLRDFCDHATPKDALALFEKGEKYWIHPAGDVQLFLRTQAAQALGAISRAKDVEAAVQAVGAIQNVIGSHLGVHFFETKQYLNQSKLQVQEGKVLVIELLCALRNNKFNSIEDPEDSLTAREIHKALTAVAKASGVAPRVEIKFQRVPSTRRRPRNASDRCHGR